jgi:hypothetical protein
MKRLEKRRHFLSIYLGAHKDKERVQSDITKYSLLTDASTLNIDILSGCNSCLLNV